MENSQSKLGSFYFERKTDMPVIQLEGTKSETKKESPLAKIVNDAVKISEESTHGMIGQVVKNLVFNWKNQKEVNR